MKKYQFIFSACLLLFSLNLRAQDSQIQTEREIYPVTISIVGTSKYQETDYIVKNLKRSNQIADLVVSTSGRNLIELKGNYTGSQETLINEIEGLSQDRYEVEIIKSKKSTDLSVTLRKLPPPGSEK